MKNKYLMVCLILFALFIKGSLAQADPYYRDISSGGTSAQHIGIGSIQGFTDQASVLFESPVGLTQAGNSFSGFYTSYFEGIQYMSTAVSVKPLPKLTLGVGGVGEWSSDLDSTSTDSSGEYYSQNTFGASVTQFVAGGAYEVSDKWAIGGSFLHYITRVYEVRGKGSDLGMGVRYRSKKGDILFNVKNMMGRQVVFTDHTSESLASQWSLGYKSVPITVWNTEFYGQIKKTSGVSAYAKGFGVRVYPLKSNLVSMSLGYNEKQGITKLKSTLSAGVILNLGAMSLEYGFDKTDVYQGSQQHYVSLAIKY